MKIISLSRALLSSIVATSVFAGGCGSSSSDTASVAEKRSAGANTRPPSVASNWAGNTTVIPSAITTKVKLPSLDKGSVYIVQMKDDPAAAIASNGRYDSSRPEARNHVARLERQQRQARGRNNVQNQPLYSYTHSFNGFAIELSAAEAVRLAHDPDVAKVWADEARELHTNFSPEFLGLDAPNGPWDSGILGEDIVIGVIDTGIWPENESFSDSGDHVYGSPPSHFRGRCQSGEQWSQQDCNNKVIGARYFPYGFGASPRGTARNGVNPLGYNSARDDASSGHGSHTAGTAAGNRGVTQVIGGTEALGDSEASGVAPRARIISYKVCWNDDGCILSDLVAAIDTAVADGVDVINYSIGGGASLFGADDVAFLFANAAGVHVATSASNDGPGPGTIASPAVDPWILSVGASTRTGIRSALGARVNSPDSVAGDYAAIEGAITRPLTVSGPVSGDLAAADPLLACDPLTNDLSGKVALIERGACTFVAKVTNAVNAGATAVLMFTDGRPKTAMGGDATGTTKSVPGVMIDRDPGVALATELDGGSTVNVTLDAGVLVAEDSIGNVMADFSSRGPNVPIASDVIKPDVTAPGVSILAPITPTPLPEGVQQNTGELYGYRSGTSMSSPHAAGALALIKQAHPDWSPAMAKSALMTTARQDVLKEDGSTPADPFDIGGGHIQPGKALDPGLVYDAGLFDFAAFICSVNPNFWAPGTCEFLAGEGFDVTDPTQLNYPSIGVSSLVGTKTVNRTVTAISGGTYCASIESPPGIDAAVTDGADGGCFDIAEGETHTYALTLSSTDDVVTNQWAFGAITWSDGSHDVRSPIAVNAVGIDAPAQVNGTGTEGQLQFDIGFGFSGEYNAGVHGLNPALEIQDNVADDPDNSYDFPNGPGITRVFWVYEEGTAFSRWQLRDDFTDGNDDLDLYVWECDSATFACGLAGASTTATSAETVDLLFPEAGAPDLSSGTFYVIDVHGWETDGADANYTLFEWEFGLVDDAGNMTVDPASVDAALGATQTLTVDYAGLDEGVKYIGAISHSSPGGLEGLTLISVE